MMQLHHELERLWLPLADALDRAGATAARAGLHAWGAAARAAQGRPPIDFIAGPATAHELVSDGRLARLLRYRARGAARPTPILIVASLINRYYVLDLLPELSVIDKLCAAGFEVYVLDWKAPGAGGPRLRFADYVDGAIAEAADYCARASKPIVLGYCMGGMLAALFAARHPERLRALCLLGTPIDFHASGPLASFTDRRRFDADLLIDALGNMPPAMMQSGFKLLSPSDALFKLIHLWLDAGDEARLRHVVAVESWLEDNVAFPGGVYREYIGRLYQDNALIAGRLLVGGEPIELARLTAPLCNVVALNDRICAPPASRALMDRVGTPPADRELVEFDTGHIGLTTSRRAHAELWPRLIKWMEARA